MDTRREQIFEAVMREFVGPIESDDLAGVRPQSHYCAGVLYPRGHFDTADAVNDSCPAEKDTIQDEEDLIFDQDQGAGEAEEIDVIDKSNLLRPTAMSMTVAVAKGDSLTAHVRAASYTQEKGREPRKSAYLRTQIEEDMILDLPSPGDAVGSMRTKQVPGSSLQIDAVMRKQVGDIVLYTIALENTNIEGTAAIDTICYFQSGFTLESQLGFVELPHSAAKSTDEDVLTNEFLYREVKDYAVGHGCACAWSEARPLRFIETTVMPSYEMKPIVPTDLSSSGVVLAMRDFGCAADHAELVEKLWRFSDAYKAWIDTQRSTIPFVEKRYREVAKRHIDACEKCHDRMVDGINLIRSDPCVAKAFGLMNDAMLLQQLHYAIPKNRWVERIRGRLQLENAYQDPKLEDESTWPTGRTCGFWRPFQLAFVMMNLRSMLDPSASDRKVVDLIWFPTGGGKTEAYLGLSACTIFLRRMLNRSDSGTAIIMRYTLRLLTTQQYERAASLICSCEVLRRREVELLGRTPISIGLWVGSASTPNTIESAVHDFNALSRRATSKNPFVILKCPWCGAEMGTVVLKNGMRSRTILKGYRLAKDGRKNRFIYQCDNPDCHFSHGEMPLYVIDEEIYDHRPTLVIGTVDKFAMLPFRPEARSLFGVTESGARMLPPDLIIQDELHLISGPLGSMVGSYETLVAELCSCANGGVKRCPKIVASTATISRAKAQCHALYACGTDNVFQFPPPGLTYRDSFFAHEDAAVVGRRYVGLMTHASSSIASSVRLFAVLMHAVFKLKVDSEKERDPYWTIVSYYNTLRDLGMDLTAANSLVPNLLYILNRRTSTRDGEGKIIPEARRYLRKILELTSRIPSESIAERLHDLELAHSGGEQTYAERPVDICFATNMISVGLDVSRLGVMTVMGQPKTTSEYIQATSRVGRSSTGPGIVFCVYRPERPRDKSIYENFYSYHAKLYSRVEPTSVTPFSPTVRERSLHAIVIAFYRLLSSQGLTAPTFPDDGTLMREICSVIEERVKRVDPSQVESTRRILRHVLNCWRDWNPAEWSYFGIGDPGGTPLMYVRGVEPSVAWGGRGFATMTSMRSVDAPCEIDILRDSEVWGLVDETN